METEVEEKPWFQEGLKFKCTGCGKCCTGAPGYVYLSNTDIKNLSEHFKMSSEDFCKKYTRLVDGIHALLDRAPTYDCIFLENSKCSVYESRPVQCRTFPWWVGNLRTPADWEEAATHCEGIDHEDAPIVPLEHIEKETLTYLDNLIDQNFNF
jgi:Fe-S-cluster containining protein